MLRSFGWSEHVVGCLSGTAPAEALFGRFGSRADVSRSTFMIVIRTGGTASCRTVDLAGKDPHFHGVEDNASNTLHRKLGLDRRPGNGQQPAKSMRDTPEHLANRCPVLGAREERPATGIGLIIAVGRCFCPLLRPAMRAPSYSGGIRAAATIGLRPALGGEIDVSRRAAQAERRRTAVTVSIPRCQPPDVVEGGHRALGRSNQRKSASSGRANDVMV